MPIMTMMFEPRSIQFSRDGEPKVHGLVIAWGQWSCGYISRHSDSKLASIVSFGGPPQELFDGNLVMQLGGAPWSRGS